MSMSSIVSNRRLRHLPPRPQDTTDNPRQRTSAKASNLPEQRASAGTNRVAAHAAMSASFRPEADETRPSFKHCWLIPVQGVAVGGAFDSARQPA